jgi:hypothetical protein
MAERIERDCAANTSVLARFSALTAFERLYAQHNFPRAERLGHVIIGAEF